MKEMNPIKDINELTPLKLTEILVRNGFIEKGEVIEIVNTTVLREWDDGQKTFGLDLKYSESVKGQQIPSSIVVKILSKNDKVITNQEAKFYSLLGSKMAKQPIPTCYDSVFSEKTGFSHVIMDDFSKTHDQNLEYPSSKLTFKKAIDSLAEIHAYWWDSKNLDNITNNAFIFCPTKFNQTFFEGAFINEEEKFLIRLGENITSGRKKILEKIFSCFSETAEKRDEKGNMTLLHNDAHTINFTFPKKEYTNQSKAILFDWESWGFGVGPADISYMIGFWYWPDYRHLLEEYLVRYYYNCLLKYGVKSYSWDQCMYDYKLFMLSNIYRIVWWWKIGLRSSIWWRGLEMSLMNIEDLNCLDLLEK